MADDASLSERAKGVSLPILATGVWLLAAIAGLAVLWRYELTDRPVSPAPESWPEGTTLSRDGRPTLVLVAHPLCPCTRASIGELSVLMARSVGRLDARVVFVEPEGMAPARESASWQRAAAIPGVIVVSDPGGREAALFKASTSGHTVLYDAAGRLVFVGGITSARGHLGDNTGRSGILAWLGDSAAAPPTNPVFGCSLTAH